MFLILFLTLLPYTIGSLSFSILVSQFMGLPDPRQYGSHNPGATNVLRSGRWWAAALTLFGDAAKGWLAVQLTMLFVEKNELFLATLPSPIWVGFAMVTVVFGHIYPVFYGFIGGKGVATALGTLLAIKPLLAGVACGTWLLVAACTRYSSLSAMTAALLTCIVSPLLLPGRTIPLAILSQTLLLLWRHRTNLLQLIAGTERRMGR